MVRPPVEISRTNPGQRGLLRSAAPTAVSAAATRTYGEGQDSPDRKDRDPTRGHRHGGTLARDTAWAMSLENVETVITSMAVVVITAILLKFAIVGFEAAADKTTGDTASVYDVFGPASRSCGDFRLPDPSQQVDLQEAGIRAGVRDFLIKVEVVQGNVPCRVARRLMKAQFGWRLGPSGWEEYEPRGTSSWRCSGFEGITGCEKDHGRDQGAIRGRQYCRDWVYQGSCSKFFGPSGRSFARSLVQ
jgi:hypothetical protein